MKSASSFGKDTQNDETQSLIKSESDSFHVNSQDNIDPPELLEKNILL